MLPLVVVDLHQQSVSQCVAHHRLRRGEWPPPTVSTHFTLREADHQLRRTGVVPNTDSEKMKLPTAVNSCTVVVKQPSALSGSKCQVK